MRGIIFNIQRFSLHDGAGIRTTVFFKGCNLRCKWCSNPESQSFEAEQLDGKTSGTAYTVDEVLQIVLKDKVFYDKSGGGVTLSGGEPLCQPEFFMQLCIALRENGVSVAVETAANVDPEIWSGALKLLDSAQIDLKHYDSAKHRQYTGSANERIIANIRYALGQPVPVIIRIPVIPGFNSTDADAHMFSKLLKELGAKEVHILPFHQFGESKYEKLGMKYEYSGVRQMREDELDNFAKIIKNSGIEVQIGG